MDIAKVCKVGTPVYIVKISSQILGDGIHHEGVQNEVGCDKKLLSTERR